jgi:uncharacterized membrane protein
VKLAAQQRPPVTSEDGQMLVFLVGLVVVIFMVLALGWDSANWFLGHRALNNLCDGAAVAAANEIDVEAYYRSEGRRTTVVTANAAATVSAYMQDAAGDSGVSGVRVAAVTVRSAAAGPSVTVELEAPAQVLFLRWLGVVPPSMSAAATATARPG